MRRRFADQGATLITDRESDRGNGYNIGEMEVAAALARECHYMEKRDEYGGTGVWTPQSGNSRDQDQVILPKPRGILCGVPEQCVSDMHGRVIMCGIMVNGF